jgi:hypothetical protein
VIDVFVVIAPWEFVVSPMRFGVHPRFKLDVCLNNGDQRRGLVVGKHERPHVTAALHHTHDDSLVGPRSGGLRARVRRADVATALLATKVSLVGFNLALKGAYKYRFPSPA